MLIENVVFNFYEVGEKGFADIKNECLSHFASRLRECLTSSNERIRKFWVDRGLSTSPDAPFKGSTANYKIFQDLYGSKIKYNSKSIVFEETITNNPESIWNVKQYCMDMYNLEYVEETEQHSGYLGTNLIMKFFMILVSALYVLTEMKLKKHLEIFIVLLV